MKFLLERNTSYHASILLGTLEAFASNNQLAEKLKAVGFGDVKVEGTGSKRLAIGVWKNPTQNVEVPPQVVHVHKSIKAL